MPNAISLKYNPTAGLAAGVAAGLVAAWAMNAMQGLVPVKSPGNANPSTLNAANAVSRAVTGKPLAKRNGKAGANAIHYTFGALLGGLYGAVAEIWPRVTLAMGIPFGLAIAAVADEIMVPALGFSAPPWKSPLKLHAYGTASHVLFGAVAEIVRKILRPVP